MGYIGNAPYQGVITSGNIVDGSIDTADLKNSAVTAGKLAATLDLTGKTVTLPAGVGGHASGTEANRPAAPAIGTIYFNTDEDTLQQYTSTGWKDVGPTPPVISSVSGNIYNTTATNLTISGSAFGVGATVRFSYGVFTSDVSVTPTSDTEITVAVPSAVYNQAGGTAVTISVLVSGEVSNGSSKTVIAPPTGGTITTSGGYLYHTFLSSSNLVVPSGFNATAEYLIVAGGGGGGGYGGGGGAGGVVTGSVSLSASTNTVTVGIGGDAATQYTSPGSDGLLSSIFSVNAVGGGGGGTYALIGRTGGSGGGGGFGQLGGAGTAGQGFAGGASDSVSTPYPSGGGGGAGAVGGLGTGVTGGAGGVGTSLFSAWASATLTGHQNYYAGGGGGGVAGGNGYSQDGIVGQGGIGGGGTGQKGGHTSSTPGLQNTGGGGGGGGYNGDAGSATPSNGGSGIVIVRYQL